MERGEGQPMSLRRIDRRSDGRFDLNTRPSIIDFSHTNRSSDNQAAQAMPETTPRYSRRTDIAMNSQGLDVREELDSVQILGHNKDNGGLTNSDKASATVTKVYTIAYLVLFAILGTLARLGLQALTFFPGAPIVFSELWANFAGTIVMGFLMEDRKLFLEEWGTPVYANERLRARNYPEDENRSADLAAAKKAHGATKKTIPLYIGLATGFCGSFTSFSSFIRDAFLAPSNDLPTPLSHPTDLGANGVELTSVSTTVPRNAAFSILAVLAVLIITLSLCVRGLYFGIQLAELLEPCTPTLPFIFIREFLDRFVVVVALGTWATVIVLAIFPPNPTWRGIALFALVFAPLGGLVRFYASMCLNPYFPQFPLGTFFVNILGTAMLGMAFNFQHSAAASVISCQVFQGLMDGFCGCLTTISTWIVELTTLKKAAAYSYGSLSIAVALSLLVAIMGPFRWTVGFATLKCVH
jgi:CrcB protein